jgi:hypothetical protein
VEFRRQQAESIEGVGSFKKGDLRAKYAIQWQNAYLAYVRPWIPFYPQ